MTFAQLSARLKNFLRGWLLVLGLKEGLVECATVCVKSVVILTNNQAKQERVAVAPLRRGGSASSAGSPTAHSKHLQVLPRGRTDQ